MRIKKERVGSAHLSQMTSTVPHNNIVLTSPKEIVHLEYDPETLPPPPSYEGWTRFVCISDTHSRAFDVPDGDVLLHGGDLTNTGTVEEFQKTMTWLYGLPHKIKMLVFLLFFENPSWCLYLFSSIIAGNHDLPLHTSWYNTHYLGWHRRIGKQVSNN